MRNGDIADAFEELASLYELDGAVVYRVVAYRNAAKAIREAGVSVEEMARQGRVEELAGVGRTIAEKIDALIESGSIPSADKLKARIPAGLVEITRIPGLGPKRARLLYDELGVSSLDELRAAAEQGRLKDVPGFGKKAEENVLAALAAGADGRPKARMLLSKALAVGEELVAALREHPSAIRVELAGSARRMTDAVRRGLHVSEYGIADDESGESQAFTTEHEVYERLGMQFIPPELRENRGELEAARKHRLPELIEVGDIRGDLHMHTVLSDGRNTLEEMAQAARDHGYDYVAITEHSASHGFGNDVQPDELRRHAERIRSLDVPGLTALAGTETNVLPDGSLDYDDGVLEELDWVIASLHTSFRMSEKEQTDRMLRAMEHPLVDAIGHPTGRMIGSREPYALDIDRVIEKAVETGTFLEINANPHRRDLNDVYARAAAEG